MEILSFPSVVNPTLHSRLILFATIFCLFTLLQSEENMTPYILVILWRSVIKIEMNNTLNSSIFHKLLVNNPNEIYAKHPWLDSNLKFDMFQETGAAKTKPLKFHSIFSSATD